MVGFGLAVPGYRNGHSYLHSHMVGVRKDFQNRGLGRKIKFFQRDDALARGFELIEWTFDPLEIKNAYLNLEKLGAITRRYTVNQYGITTSPLQGGLPTDRLVAEWWLNSRRVKAAAQGQPMPSITPELRIPVTIGRRKRQLASRLWTCRAGIVKFFCRLSTITWKF